MRKADLTRLLAHRPKGIFISEFERGEIGPGLFRKACEKIKTAFIAASRLPVQAHPIRPYYRPMGSDAMLTFGGAAGPVRNKAELKKFFEILPPACAGRIGGSAGLTPPALRLLAIF
jgi:hypothetical protein